MIMARHLIAMAILIPLASGFSPLVLQKPINIQNCQAWDSKQLLRVGPRPQAESGMLSLRAENRDKDSISSGRWGDR